MKGVVMKNRNWFWGFFFLLLAVFVIASQTGVFGQINAISILETVFFATLVVHSLIKRNFFGIFIPLSFLYMIYSKPLAFVYISPWLLVLSAVLTSIGFSLLFRKRPKNVAFSHSRKKHFSQINENLDDNNPYIKVSLSSSSTYLHSDCLKGGHFVSHLGELDVYFDQVQLSPDGVEIFLECNLGSIKLYIPRSWYVVDNTHSILGDVNNNTQHTKPSENAPHITITGNVTLGSVKIEYI
jgi:hypothetical protein